MKKFTPKQIKILKAGWKKFEEIEQDFHDQLYDLEQELSDATGVENIEFFQCDGSYVGIGNADRTIKLLHLR